ncbi:MAG TPA: alpha-2-macroglobulin family protein [Kofleriaceae bacterium]|jgi:hypothetical protein
MNKLTLIVSTLALVAGCKGRDKMSSNDRFASESVNSVAAREDMDMAPGAAMALDEGKMGRKDMDRAEGQYKMKAEAPAMQTEKAGAVADAKAAGVLGGMGDISSGFDSNGTGRYGTIGHGSGTGSGYGVGGGRGGGKGGQVAETSVRAWFPETFLFEPLIVTDDNGNATVPVRVPDRLTTWHILALAHSRQGSQGGATTSFLGTLPTYVDLVVPKFLVVGDRIKLPIQVVNTTDAAVTADLSIDVQGATVTGGAGRTTVPAQGNVVAYATLEATKPGKIIVQAGLGGTDAVRREIEVRPAGRPETVTRTGTLAEPRTLMVAGPAGSDPATDRVRLLVYPGALALLRTELGVSTARTGVADDAYALLLAGKASALLASLGDKADPDAIRDLSILTGQRAIRDGRTLDVDRAGLLVEAALAHRANPILARLGQRAAQFLAEHQRPDGTFAGGTGWTLQRMLIATADAVRAVNTAVDTTEDRQRAQGVTLRAASAFERTAEQVTDGYTAAAILASGGASGALADTLRERVRTAIKPADDGSKYLEVGEGVVRADGSVPSVAEATALAVLALAADPKAPLGDLGGTLLGSYSPDYGWGDGRANLACMQAVVSLFKTPVPEGVHVTLQMDGKPVADGTLDRAALRDVLSLEAPVPSGFAGGHEWKLVAEPAVPGLGFSLALRGWVPWEKQTVQSGLEMSLTPETVSAEVGKPVEVTLTAIAPSGTPIKIVQSLPAGVQVDTPSLELLQSSGLITKFEASDGKLELTVAPLQPGTTFFGQYKLIPTLAGSLRSAASTLSAAGTTFPVPPVAWTVK